MKTASTEEQLAKAKARVIELQRRMELQADPKFQERSKDAAAIRKAIKIANKYLGPEDDILEPLTVLAVGIRDGSLEDGA